MTRTPLPVEPNVYARRVFRSSSIRFVFTSGCPRVLVAPDVGAQRFFRDFLGTESFGSRVDLHSECRRSFAATGGDLPEVVRIRFGFRSQCGAALGV